MPEHITQAGQEMYLRKESPSKCFTSTDLRLKVGDAKKLSFKINIGKNQRIKVNVASLHVVLCVPVKYIYEK